VIRIEAPRGHVDAVVLAGGERLLASRVIAAIDPKTALLELLDPPVGGALRRDLEAARRGNVVQALVHVATSRPPRYPAGRPGDWNGLQSFVDRLGDLRSAWVAAEAGELADPLPFYCFTPSVLDGSLAAPAHHTVYIACPAAPATIRGGWERRADEFVESALGTLEARAPGFRGHVQGVSVRTPAAMQAEGLPGAHPMHLDIAPDQLGLLRPTRSLAGHRTPISGLYLSGAGTPPSGGILGTPGRLAAQALLQDLPRPAA
jgi:phytoene dehydrogenase-like protein